jgi:hypothetical protein
VGRSVHMAGLAASLKAISTLAVTRVYPDLPTAHQTLANLVPDVVVFDLVDPYPDLTLALLRERPGLLLLGMDPSSDEMLVLSGHPARALNMQDVVQTLGSLSPVNLPSEREPIRDRLSRFVLSKWILIPRQQKIAIVFAGIVVCAALALGLGMTSMNHADWLAGAAIERAMAQTSPRGWDNSHWLTVIMFGFGMILGSVLSYLWLSRFTRQRHK